VTQEISTNRIIIVGAGLGALYAALKLAPRPVVLISPERLGEGASSAWAQGGVAAALDEKDDPKNHAQDTVRAGAGTVDEEIATLVTHDARQYVLDLTRMGTDFDRAEDGSYALSREAAHSFARVARVKGDQAGAEIMSALSDLARETASIQTLEGVMAVDLEVKEGRVTGVAIQSSDDARSKPILLRAPAVLLAGGGSGGLFAVTTNPPRIRGQVIGMAARAGARIADAEFVQFHPTAIDVGEDPAPLATEALRGEGAILLNRHGERFMQKIHPDAELAPRDIVAREIYAQSQKGNRPLLDTRDAIGPDVIERFPAVAEACLRNGINPAEEPIPVAAAAHYHMGGIDTDANGHATLDGLWVCGEASSTGLHGANRLASNGLLEALVFARICAEGIAAEVPVSGEAAQIELAFEQGGNPPNEDAVTRLRETMTAHVGVMRNEEGLATALRNLDALEREYSDSPSFLGAYTRRESRGAHERSDYPDTLAESAERSRTYLKDALALRQSLSEVTS